MDKIIDILEWLVVTNLGRYALGAILLSSGIFSQYGTIGFLRTNRKFFEYTLWAGVIILVCQFLFHILAALYYNLFK